MSKQLETTILGGFCFHEDFCNQFIPHVKPEHFVEQSSRHLFKIINRFIEKYDTRPNLESLVLELDKYEADEDLFDECKEQLGEFRHVKKLSPDYIKDEAAQYIQNRAIYNAMMESLEIVESGDPDKVSAVPDILTDAIALDFTTNCGMDFFDDAERRFEYYHDAKTKIPFHLDCLNKATKGGVEPKTLNIILGGTNTGKTALMTDFAANYMLQGYNVLYVTLEMAEEKIYQRIDANLFDLSMDELMLLKKDKFMGKVQGLREKSVGRIKVKEYPPSTANARHISSLLKDLKLHSGFVPDIICVDYINLLQSSRFSSSNNNSYTIVKAIAEELRGIAVSHNTAVWSATQMNREGFATSDVDLTHTSESFGVPATADFMFAMLTSEQLKSAGKLLFKQLKSRYDDIGKMPAFTVGVDFEKMKTYDIQQSANIQQEVKNEPVDQDDLYAKFKGGSKKKVETSDLKV